ncbi:hypothetical protein EDD18DRAFT_1094216 [Armillaria luteobubalina]|uniref:Uncharacterized protein n=1 Tax=Armillaria luteobubalina TaxID=153913 RepID=A0AA39NV74_9AGAR|nr:hypothetical protein EDD18DRAFT_1094216 [Armillaria luteobubalina]
MFLVVFVSVFAASAISAETSPDNPDSVPVCAEDQRTVLSILWGCFATIFACTWIAVHPNVPGRDITTKGTVSCAIERLKIWSITMLAPEVIVAWAAEQLIVARKLLHGKSNLTLAHCFLLTMGGLYCHGTSDDMAASTSPSSSFSSASEDFAYFKSEVDGSESDRTASSDSTALIRGTLVTLLETIEDKNKRDAMSKAFSILQSSWFISQCVARAIQHLPITLLEMTALAFAGISMITYLLWWYKPLNVKYHIPLASKFGPMPETSFDQDSAHPVKPWSRTVKFTAWMWHTLMGKPPRRYYMSTENGAPQF